LATQGYCPCHSGLVLALTCLRQMSAAIRFRVVWFYRRSGGWFIIAVSNGCRFWRYLAEEDPPSPQKLQGDFLRHPDVWVKDPRIFFPKRLVVSWQAEDGWVPVLVHKPGKPWGKPVSEQKREGARRRGLQQIKSALRSENPNHGDRQSCR